MCGFILKIYSIMELEGNNSLYLSILSSILVVLKTKPWSCLIYVTTDVTQSVNEDKGEIFVMPLGI